VDPPIFHAEHGNLLKNSQKVRTKKSQLLEKGSVGISAKGEKYEENDASCKKQKKKKWKKG